MTHLKLIDPKYKKKNTSDPMIFAYQWITSIIVLFGYKEQLLQMLQFTFSASVLLSIFSLSVLCFLSAPFGCKMA